MQLQRKQEMRYALRSNLKKTRDRDKIINATMRLRYFSRRRKDYTEEQFELKRVHSIEQQAFRLVEYSYEGL